MTLLAVTPEQIANNGKAYVEAFAIVANAIIAQIGILFLAGIGVYRSIEKQLPTEFKARLDRYNERLDRVAIATVAAAPEEKKAEVAVAVARAPVPGEPVKPTEIPPIQTEPEKLKPEPLIE